MQLTGRTARESFELIAMSLFGENLKALGKDPQEVFNQTIYWDEGCFAPDGRDIYLYPKINRKGVLTAVNLQLVTNLPIGPIEVMPVEGVTVKVSKDNRIDIDYLKEQYALLYRINTDLREEDERCKALELARVDWSMHLGQALKEEGYKGLYVGKQHYGRQGEPKYVVYTIEAHMYFKGEDAEKRFFEALEAFKALPWVKGNFPFEE